MIQVQGFASKFYITWYKTAKVDFFYRWVLTFNTRNYICFIFPVRKGLRLRISFSLGIGQVSGDTRCLLHFLLISNLFRKCQTFFANWPILMFLYDFEKRVNLNSGSTSLNSGMFVLLRTVFQNQLFTVYLKKCWRTVWNSA